MIAILLSLAFAADGEPDDVRTATGRGAWINWSDLSVEVEAGSYAGGVATRKSAEAEARKVLGPRLASAAREAVVSGEITLGELEAGPALGESIKTRLARWHVSEARYYASGRVELVGELDLTELFKPWTLSNAEEAPSDSAEPAFTGLVLDARGQDFVPVWAPILAGGEMILWSGALWEDVAYERAPAVYVSDAAHPAALRAGNNPLFATVVGTAEGTLQISDEDAVRVRTAFGRSRTLGDGKVVVVVDP